MKAQNSSFYDTIKKMLSPRKEQVVFKKYENYTSLVNNFKARIEL